MNGNDLFSVVAGVYQDPYIYSTTGETADVQKMTEAINKLVVTVNDINKRLYALELEFYKKDLHYD